LSGGRNNGSAAERNFNHLGPGIAPSTWVINRILLPDIEEWFVEEHARILEEFLV
jgi:hypothetical protein